MDDATPGHEPLPAAKLSELSDTAAARRVSALRAAALAKRQAAVDRAEAGLRGMIKAGQPIEFRALARAAGVSVNFLYSHDELRTRVQQLRDQQDHQEQQLARPHDASGATHSAVVRGLTSKLTAERRRRLDEVGLLREQLAAAHGELLRLRRALPQALPAPQLAPGGRSSNLDNEPKN